jgi:hypothetical protein
LGEVDLGDGKDTHTQSYGDAKIEYVKAKTMDLPLRNGQVIQLKLKKMSSKEGGWPIAERNLK